MYTGLRLQTRGCRIEGIWSELAVSLLLSVLSFRVAAARSTRMANKSTAMMFFLIKLPLPDPRAQQLAVPDFGCALMNVGNNGLLGNPQSTNSGKLCPSVPG